MASSCERVRCATPAAAADSWVPGSRYDGLLDAAWIVGLAVTDRYAYNDRERAERLRAKLPTDELADRLSVVWRRTPHLPYLDNLADMIVADG